MPADRLPSPFITCPVCGEKRGARVKRCPVGRCKGYRALTQGDPCEGCGGQAPSHDFTHPPPEDY